MSFTDEVIWDSAEDLIDSLCDSEYYDTRDLAAALYSANKQWAKAAADTLGLYDCPYCGRPLVVATGRVVYPHRKDLRRKRFYLCAPCEAWVGTHKDTRTPLGSAAKKPRRAERMKAHDAFDPLWRDGRFKTRSSAYRWLARELGIEPERCHIALMDEAECRRVQALCLFGDP